MGRPSKLNRQVQEQICEHLRAGAHRRFAASMVDLDESMLSRWYHRGAGEERGIYREFFLAVNKAEAEFATTGVEMLRTAAAKNPKIMQFVLSRRFPSEFGRRDNIEHEDPEDKAAQQAATQQLLMERLERLFPDPPEAPEEAAAAPPAAEPHAD